MAVTPILYLYYSNHLNTEYRTVWVSRIQMVKSSDVADHLNTCIAYNTWEVVWQTCSIFVGLNKVKVGGWGQGYRWVWLRLRLEGVNKVKKLVGVKVCLGLKREFSSQAQITVAIWKPDKQIPGKFNIRAPGYHMLKMSFRHLCIFYSRSLFYKK